MNWRDLKPGDRVEITLTGVVAACGGDGVGFELDAQQEPADLTVLWPEELDAATIRRVVRQ